MQAAEIMVAVIKRLVQDGCDAKKQSNCVLFCRRKQKRTVSDTRLLWIAQPSEEPGAKGNQHRDDVLADMGLTSSSSSGV